MWTHGLISTRHDTAQKKHLGFQNGKENKVAKLGGLRTFPTHKHGQTRDCCFQNYKSKNIAAVPQPRQLEHSFGKETSCKT